MLYPGKGGPSTALSELGSIGLAVLPHADFPHNSPLPKSNHGQLFVPFIVLDQVSGRLVGWVYLAISISLTEKYVSGKVFESAPRNLPIIN